MSDGMAPLSLVTVALTMPLSRVQEVPLSVTVTGCWAAACWAISVRGNSTSVEALRIADAFIFVLLVGSATGGRPETISIIDVEVVINAANWVRLDAG